MSLKALLSVWCEQICIGIKEYNINDNRQDGQTLLQQKLYYKPLITITTNICSFQRQQLFVWIDCIKHTYHIYVTVQLFALFLIIKKYLKKFHSKYFFYYSTEIFQFPFDETVKCKHDHSETKSIVLRINIPDIHSELSKLFKVPARNSVHAKGKPPIDGLLNAFCVLEVTDWTIRYLDIRGWRRGSIIISKWCLLL